MEPSTVGAICSLLLGCIFGWTGISKLRNPKAFVLSVIEYRVLPLEISTMAGYTLPWLECAVAVLLLTGTAVRVAAVLCVLFLLSFIAAVGINMVRGRQIECACIGGGGGRMIGWRVLIEDGALLVLAVVTAYVARGWWNVESWGIIHVLKQLHS
jgi:putative oxidoreductase